MIGARLAHYEITSHLGTGGMGEVYQATDSKLGRSVAIKLLPEVFTHDAERVARFEREARVLASLNHPHIAAIYGVDESGGRKFLVMELAAGETLADRIRRGPIPMDDALRIAHQIADALESAHENGVVHRDLKPANIKIAPDGVVKVLDFGLAKAYETETSPALNLSNSPTLSRMATLQGVILGTAAYMSPEQARGKSVDKRADIWAFGAVFYEMLTGRTAFDGEDVTATLAKVIESEPSWDDVPLKVQRLLKKCLEKDPKRRLRDIGDAWELLDETVPRPSAEVRRTFLWPIVSVVLILMAAGLGAGWWHASKPEDRLLVRLDLDLGADVSLPDLPINPLILSPDGTRLAYLSGRRFFTRQLDQDKAVELPGAAGATLPFFSPDGHWIGFFTSTDNKLNKVSVEGGAVVKLADDLAGYSGGSWGEDGSIIVTQNGVALRIPDEGGKPTPITEPLGLARPEVLPGGKAVLFTRPDRDASSIEMLTLADRKVKTLIPSGNAVRYATSGHLIYNSKGTLFAVPFDLSKLATRGSPVPIRDDLAYFAGAGVAQFDMSSGGHGTLVYRRGTALEVVGPIVQSSIQWVDSTGKKQPLFAKPGNYTGFHFSPDGKRLALIANSRTVFVDGRRVLANGDVWVYDLTRDNTSMLTSGGTYALPIWTPDGKYLLLGSPGGIMWMPSDGSNQPQPLIPSKTPMAPQSLTTDGKQLRLAYQSASASPGGGEEIWTVPLMIESGQLTAGKPEMFLRGSRFLSPAFSPDGKWLAYATVDTEARGRGQFQPTSREIYVRPFPAAVSGNAGQVHISNDGGVSPVWTRHGELLYSSSTGNIMSVRYTVRDGAFEASTPQVWLANAAQGFTLFDLHPDGKRIAIATPVNTPESAQVAAPKPEHSVVFLINFLDELRRRAPAR
jgi:serine/threonine-protein kinase